MGTKTDREAIRLTIPAEDDFVAILRVAARVVAGRAGGGDDIRSRLLAAAGTAFFVLLRQAGASGSITTWLSTDDDRITLEMTPDAANPIEAKDVRDIGDGREITNGGRTLRLWLLRTDAA